MRKWNVFLAIVMALLVTALGGCAKKENTEGECQIYYLNTEKTKLEPIAYHPKSKDAKDLVEELLTKLSTNPEERDYRKALPNDVELIKNSLEGEQLSLWFDSDYYNMEPSLEVLCRASIVKTMTQIYGITGVSFFVGDTPLVDGNGKVVGLMTGDSFVENPGEQINEIQENTVTLYFANSEGDALTMETKQIHYSSSMPMEKVILENLLEGPKETEGKSAIPAGTKLLGVTTADGICYVNFDSGFMNQDSGVQEPIAIYSIVDSLTEMSSITRVQISVNGSEKGIYRDSYELGKNYERDLSFLEGTEEKEKK